VPTQVIRRTPELTVAPAAMVNAVVVAPWSAHPTDSYGYYRRDLDFHVWYEEMTRTAQGAERYLDDFVRATASSVEFVEKLDDNRIDRLRLRSERWW
jgi:glutaconate CoA-transferase, subunit A